VAEKVENEFREIGHCGGQFSVNTRTGPDGRPSYQIGVQGSSPTPAAFFMIGALEQGIPVVTIEMGGWQPDRAGEDPQPSPVFPVMIASDREGLFGHQCFQRDGYWRSDTAPGPLANYLPLLRSASRDAPLSHGGSAQVREEVL
jgi:hypothetical protein